jgi:hypothetical protein
MRKIAISWTAAALLLAAGCNVTVNNKSMDNEADALGNKLGDAADDVGNAVEQTADAVGNKADALGNMHVDVKVDGDRNDSTANTH